MDNKKQYTMTEWKQLIEKERAKEQATKKTNKNNTIKHAISRQDLK